MSTTRIANKTCLEKLIKLITIKMHINDLDTISIMVYYDIKT